MPAHMEDHSRDTGDTSTWEQWLQEPEQFWSYTSADYRATVDLADSFTTSGMGLDELLDTLRQRGLDAPHPYGCTYLAMPAPLPPPRTSVRFDARVMPAGCSGTIGEVFIMVGGLLGEEVFARIHAALHPTAGHCAPGH